jgi:hypothetical protein
MTGQENLGSIAEDAFTKRKLGRGSGLDKSLLSCHTANPFNSPTEGHMTLSAHLAELSEKHRTLELKIREELARPGSDDAQITKMKKEKLRIKDEMTKLQLRH